MSKKMASAIHREFPTITVRVFAFLTSEFGMHGPEIQEIVIPSVIFSLDGLRYQVSLDTQSYDVATGVYLELQGKGIGAELERLAFSLGAGKRGQLSYRANNLTVLQKSLISQADLLRKVHPFMLADDRVQLMQRALA